MKNKYFLFALCFTVISTINTSMVFANSPENSNIIGKLDEHLSEKAVEKSELTIIKNIQTEKMNTQTVVVLDSNGNETTSEKRDEQIRISSDNMYKVYSLNVPDIVKEYKSGNKVYNVISENYIWEAPVYNSNNEIISSVAFRKGEKVEKLKERNLKFNDKTTEDAFFTRAKSREAKWYWIRTGNMIPCSDVEFLSNSEKIADYISSLDIGTPDDIKYVSLGKFRTEIIYIRVGEKEYGITFGMRPDLTGLDNRCLYTMEQITDKLDLAFN